MVSESVRGWLNFFAPKDFQLMLSTKINVRPTIWTGNLDDQRLYSVSFSWTIAK